MIEDSKSQPLLNSLAYEYASKIWSTSDEHRSLGYGVLGAGLLIATALIVVAAIVRESK